MSSSLGLVQVIDDDPHVRQSISDLLNYAGYQVNAWPDAQTYLNASVATSQPTVILTDMRMPGFSGLDLHKTLMASDRLAPIVYVSGESSLQQSISAMKLGVIDFLIKPLTAQAVLDAISKGMVVARQMQHEREARKQLNHKLEAMAPREREVFGWLCKGYNNAEIMAAMNISLPTTKQYKASVMRQLGTGSIAQLLSMAATAGLHQPLHFMEHADKS